MCKTYCLPLSGGIIFLALSQTKTQMKKIVTLVLAIVLTTNVFALNPSREYAIKPSDFGMDYKEVIISATDDVKLAAWIFKPASESKKFMIISDDGNGNMADNIELVAQFLSVGYNVITYDYRGFGKSDDFEINKNFFIYPQFTKDVIGVVEYTRKYYTTVMDMYGIGIGAGLSLAIGANRIEVKRIIADAPYSTFEETKARMYDKLNVQVFMPLVYDKIFMEPKYALAEKGSHLYGILYIVGETDEVFGPVEAKLLQKVHPKNAEVYVVPGVESAENFTKNKNVYFDNIKKFIESHGS